MDLSLKLAQLSDKDSALAYNSLRELEALSEKENVLYPYFNDFLGMLDSDKYVFRVRGFRLLCKQAKWDTENKIDKAIDAVLHAVDDQKPTAMRQKIKALEDVARYKRTLRHKIKEKALSINYIHFNDTMHSLIEHDIRSLMQVIQSE